MSFFSLLHYSAMSCNELSFYLFKKAYSFLIYYNHFEDYKLTHYLTHNMCNSQLTLYAIAVAHNVS